LTIRPQNRRIDLLLTTICAQNGKTGGRSGFAGTLTEAKPLTALKLNNEIPGRKSLQYDRDAG